MTELTPRLSRLGDDLEAAARRDVRPRRRHSRRVAVAAVVALVAVPAAPVAGIELVSEDDVARSLPAGTLSLSGTEPDCTVVRQDVEYHCVLARPPAPEIDDWKGAVEPTVDASKHVNGGCRSLNSQGTEWSCYIGQGGRARAHHRPGFPGGVRARAGRGMRTGS